MTELTWFVTGVFTGSIIVHWYYQICIDGIHERYNAILKAYHDVSLMHKEQP